MKTILWVILAGCVCFRPSFAQTTEPPTNSGTDFLLCFERNDVGSPYDKADSASCDIYMLNPSVGSSTTVTITSRRYPLMNQQFVLAPGAYKTYRISDDWPDVWITGTDSSVDNRAIRLTATAPIVCYGMNYKLNSCDAFMGIPLSACGTDYRIMSYGTSAFTIAPMPSEFAVAAFSDSTHVTIIPSAATTSSQIIRGTGHAAGVPFTVTLMAGQCIQVQTDETIIGSDLTGSTVYADSAIAVYAGHARAEVPIGYFKPGGGNSTSRDVLVEQMSPTDSWGRTFVLSAIDVSTATNSPRPEGDLMRVLALNDSTRISVNGTPWRTLQASQFADTMIYGAVVIQASDAALVGEYAHTSVAPGGDNGDPFLAIVPSIDQTYNDYPFFASDNQVFAVQKVIITADTACINDLYLDNTTQIPSSFFRILPVTATGRTFAIVQLNIPPGVHRLSTHHTAQEGFSILGYGLGHVTSYGYTAGALLKPLRAVSIQPQTYQDRIAHQLTYRNTTAESVTIDSVQFAPYNESDAQYGIHATWKTTDDGLQMGQTGVLQFSATTDPLRSIPGKVRMYSHTANWHDLEPAQSSYTYAVGGSLDKVEGSGAVSAGLAVFPNPSSSFSNVSFSLAAAGDVSLTLYDELGRAARRIASSEFASGDHTIRLEREKLPPGYYILELSSSKLGISERVGIVISE